VERASELKSSRAYSLRAIESWSSTVWKIELAFEGFPKSLRMRFGEEDLVALRRRRFPNDADVILQRRLLSPGVEIPGEIFGNTDAVGKRLIVEWLPLTVVHIMKKKMQARMNNGPDSRRAIIPYRTCRAKYGNAYVNSLFVHPTVHGIFHEKKQ